MTLELAPYRQPAELVPQAIGRTVFNKMNGLELRTHTSALTAEQAQRINTTYDVKLYLGIHGLPRNEVEEPNSGLTDWHLPLDEEYEAFASVIDQLKPGDVLFVEGDNFSEQDSDDLIWRFSGSADTSSTTGETIKTMREVLISERRQWLEEQRTNRKIDAITYARLLADTKGIRTIVADNDTYQNKMFLDSSGAATMDQLREDEEARKRIDASRERSAANIVKDWAVEHPVPEVGPGERKPQLAILYGRAHEQGLGERFNDLGIEIQTTILDDARPEASQRAAKAAVDTMTESAANIPSLF